VPMFEPSCATQSRRKRGWRSGAQADTRVLTSGGLYCCFAGEARPFAAR
jgi:hypothetical protein